MLAVVQLFCSTCLHSGVKVEGVHIWIMPFSGQRERAMAELHGGFSSFCMEVVIVTFAHISLVKASRMAKLDVNGMGRIKFF